MADFSKLLKSLNSKSKKKEAPKGTVVQREIGGVLVDVTVYGEQGNRKKTWDKPKMRAKQHHDANLRIDMTDEDLADYNKKYDPTGLED